MTKSEQTNSVIATSRTRTPGSSACGAIIRINRTGKRLATLKAFTIRFIQWSEDIEKNSFLSIYPISFQKLKIAICALKNKHAIMEVSAISNISEKP